MGQHTREPTSPSAFLPPLKQLSSFSAGALSLVLQSLEYLYRPDLGSYTVQHPPAVDSGYVSDDENDEQPSAKSITSIAQADEQLEEAWELARNDPFERDFAMRWMTAFLGRGLDWVAEGEDAGEIEQEDRETVYEGVSSLLSACSKASESGALLREFIFADTRVPGGRAVKVVLKDEDLSSTDHTSVGLQTWGSSSVLAEHLVQSPESYGLPTRCDGERQEPIRILELGAGTGLLSLVIRNLMVQLGVSGQIVATDYHLAVLANLEDNIAANPSSTCSSTVSITAAPLDWELVYNTGDMSALQLGSCFEHPFDMIIAADVVYRPDHAKWLASVARKFLRRPSSTTPHPSFHLIAPSRPTHELTHASIQEAFSSANVSPHMTTLFDDAQEMSSQLELCITETVDIARVKSVGRADESGYREYRIEWR